MFGITVKVENDTKKVVQAADKAAFRNFSHAAASISKDAKASIVTAEGPSEPGTPPHTHKRAFLRRGIRYAASKEGAVVGPMASIVGQAGKAHEFGGLYKGQNFPERSFMEPALRRAEPRFAGSWAGSIGQ